MGHERAAVDVTHDIEAAVVAGSTELSAAATSANSRSPVTAAGAPGLTRAVLLAAVSTPTHRSNTTPPEQAPFTTEPCAVGIVVSAVSVPCAFSARRRR
jgi:hypothetical protein